MKAFVVDGWGRRGRLRVGEMPEPTLGARDVLVRVRASGVNPLDAKLQGGGVPGTVAISTSLRCGQRPGRGGRTDRRAGHGLRAGDRVRPSRRLPDRDLSPSSSRSTRQTSRRRRPGAGLPARGSRAGAQRGRPSSSIRPDSAHRSLRLLRPGGLAVGLPPDPDFAVQLGMPWLRPVLALLSRSVRRSACRLGVRYAFLFMRADGAQLREITALVESAALRRVLDRVYAFDDTPAALDHVRGGHAKGEIVVTLD